VTVELILIYLVAGVAAGLVSGLFGLGGGLTIVPALAFALPLEGVMEKYVMHLAIGTSLVVMVVTALYTTVLRHRRGDLDWVLFRRLALRVVIGAVLAAICGDLLPGVALRIFFIGFVSYTIARALHRRYGASVRSGESEMIEAPPSVPAGASLWTYGLATGVCAVPCSEPEQPSSSSRTFALRGTGSNMHRPWLPVFQRLSVLVRVLGTWLVG
jgi:uncharacterized protein